LVFAKSTSTKNYLLQKIIIALVVGASKNKKQDAPTELKMCLQFLFYKQNTPTELKIVLQLRIKKSNCKIAP
jgi:hypothetical protein